MSLGRVIGTSAAVATVGAAAVAVVGMASAQTTRHRPLAERRPPVAAPTHRIPAQLPVAPGAPRSSARAVRAQPETVAAPKLTAATTGAVPSTSARVTSTAPASTVTTRPVVTRMPVVQRAAAPSTSAPSSAARPTPAPTPARTTTPHTTAPRTTVPRRGVHLPVSGFTGRATRVITVRAHATWDTVATLQAWRKAPGGGWLRVGKPASAHIGSDGMTRSPSESRSATPIGSFTLTQAFGYAGNPGTHLRYFRTSGADWWISQSGPLYNTHQHCWSGCRFNQGSPNEHLYYERPYYKYAVVIDYNTRNSPRGVRQGAGSAFFLHVTDGRPTAGCVAIREARLKPIMRWLAPTAHPRILIGTS
jgi:L,D-peptidoglycan transpeptidase YkuD (ErfK/YbiS/YcfS/YnhG family)